MPQPRHQVQDSSLARTCPRPRPRHLSSHPSLNGQLQRQVTTSLDDDRQKAPTPSSPRSVQWIASRCHSRGETRGTGTRQARRCRPRGRAGRVGPRAPNPFFSFPVPPTLHPPFLRPPAARRALHDIKPQPSIRIPQCKSPGRRQAPPPPPGTSRCGMGCTLTLFLLGGKSAQEFFASFYVLFGSADAVTGTPHIPGLEFGGRRGDQGGTRGGKRRKKWGRGVLLGWGPRCGGRGEEEARGFLPGAAGAVAALAARGRDCGGRGQGSLL